MGMIIQKNCKLKMIIATVVALLMFYAVPVAYAAETVPEVVIEPQEIVFNDEASVVGVGRTIDLPYTLYPEDASADMLEVTVSNAKIATCTVNETEAQVVRVVGLATGKATITLKYGKSIVAKKEISVVEVLPEDISIIAEDDCFLIGEKGSFSVKYMPADVTKQTVTWKSSASNILKVNRDGSFQAVGVGKATITAKHASGVTKTIEIEVLPIEVERISLKSNWNSEKPFYKNNTMTIQAEVFPQNATDKTITWSSSDETIATVTNKGVVKAIAAGTVKITGTASNGKEASIRIVVEPSPQKFRVSASISMRSNDHVGNNWHKGFEFNGETLKSGSTVAIMVGDSFTIGGWAEENDKDPDYNSYIENLTLTEEMCKSGFTVEGEISVRENGGRYSGNYAEWYLKIKFTPIK